MTIVFLLELFTSAPREAVDLENAIVDAPIIQDSLGRGVVVALVVRHADPYTGRKPERPAKSLSLF
jgi:hypothetical protein